MVREIAYITKDGTSVLARQFYVEQGTNQYFVTVVNLPIGPAVDYDAVEYAADDFFRREDAPDSDRLRSWGLSHCKRTSLLQAARHDFAVNAIDVTLPALAVLGRNRRPLDVDRLAAFL